jgi:hypothetical protein
MFDDVLFDEGILVAMFDDVFFLKADWWLGLTKVFC